MAIACGGSQGVDEVEIATRIGIGVGRLGSASDGVRAQECVSAALNVVDDGWARRHFFQQIGVHFWNGIGDHEGSMTYHV